MPNGFARPDQLTSITFVGDLFAEPDLLALGKLYQDATGFHEKHPRLPG